MNADLAILLLRKLKVPNAIKGGLFLSYIVFYSLDVNGRVERAMASKMSA